MASYTCLRDNFTFSRFHYEGRVYEFPDEKAAKYPKNFKLVTSALTTTASSVSVALVTAPPPAESVVPKKEYKCSVCGKVVSTAIGLSGHSRSHKGEKNVSTN